MSARAPPGFTIDDKVQAIATLIKEHSPDILALQKVDSGRVSQLTKILQDKEDYVLLGEAASHEGLACLFVKADSCCFNSKAVQGRPETIGPAVVARLSVPVPAHSAQQPAVAAATSALFDPLGAAPAAAAEGEAQQESGKKSWPWQGKKESPKEHKESHKSQQSSSGSSSAKNKILYLASCHFPPSTKNADQRAAQLETLLRHINDKDPEAAVIFAGDMNMRDAETKGALKLGLQDAFILADSSNSSNGGKFTWDSTVNQYAEGAKPFASRYDRVFVRGLEVKGYSLVGDKPVGGKRGLYLSDHFGVCTQLQLLA